MGFLEHYSLLGYFEINSAIGSYQGLYDTFTVSGTKPV